MNSSIFRDFLQLFRTVTRGSLARFIVLAMLTGLASVGLRSYLPVAFGRGLDGFLLDVSDSDALIRLVGVYVVFFVTARLLRVTSEWLVGVMSHRFYRDLTLLCQRWMLNRQPRSGWAYSIDEQSLAVDRGSVASVTAGSTLFVGVLPLVAEIAIGGYFLADVTSATTTVSVLMAVALLIVISCYQALIVGQLERHYFEFRLAAFGTLADQVEQGDLFRRYQSQSYASDRLRRRHDPVHDSGQRVTRARGWIGVAQAIVLGLGVACIIYTTGAETASGRGSIGLMVTALLLYMQLTVPAMVAGESLLTLVSGVTENAQMLRALDLSDPRELVTPKSNHQQSWETTQATDNNALQLDDVSVRGAEGQELLAGIDLSIPLDALTVVVGATGSGKSTLCRVMSGIAPPDQGLVVGPQHPGTGPLVAGEAQVPELLDGSRRENLLASNPVASDAEMYLALSLGGLVNESKVASLDDTLGTSGIQLSGGETKLVGIARTMLRQPRLTILDEPTSGLDDHLAQAVVSWLMSLDTGVVCATHDPRIVAIADHVVIIEGGRVTAEGPSSALRDKLATLGLAPNTTNTPDLHDLPL